MQRTLCLVTILGLTTSCSGGDPETQTDPADDTASTPSGGDTGTPSSDTGPPVDPLDTASPSTATTGAPSAADGPLALVSLDEQGVVFHDVEFGNGTFVALSQGGRFTSTDGLTWQRTGTPGFGSLFLDVTFDGTHFVSHGGTLETSNDGYTWTEVSANQCDLQCLGMTELVGDGTAWVGVGSSSDVFRADGLDAWSTVDLGGVGGLAHIGGTGSDVLIADHSAQVARSADGGLTFSAFAPLPAQDVYDIEYVDGEWVVLSDDGIFVSSDGQSFIGRSERWGQGIATDGNTWVVAADGYVMAGADLETIAADPDQDPSLARAWADVAFGNGFVVVVGDGIAAGTIAAR